MNGSHAWLLSLITIGEKTCKPVLGNFICRPAKKKFSWWKNDAINVRALPSGSTHNFFNKFPFQWKKALFGGWPFEIFPSGNCIWQGSCHKIFWNCCCLQLLRNALWVLHSCLVGVIWCTRYPIPLSYQKMNRPDSREIHLFLLLLNSFNCKFYRDEIWKKIFEYAFDILQMHFLRFLLCF